MWAEHQFMVLLLVNFNKSKDILRSYFYLHLPFGKESVLKFMCPSSNISVDSESQDFFLLQRISNPRCITCVHVYLLEIWQEDSNGSSCCGAYLELTGAVCCCLLVLWYLWYHFTNRNSGFNYSWPEILEVVDDTMNIFLTKGCKILELNM